MHGHEVECAERTVDVGDELADLAFKARGVGQCGRSDLDENNFADPFGILDEQTLEGSELVLLKKKKGLYVSECNFFFL